MRRLSKRVLLLFATLLSVCSCSTVGDVSRGDPRTDVTGYGKGELAFRFRAQTPNVIFFDFNDVRLDDEARRRLDSQSAWIKKHESVQFAVIGHTDKVGDTTYNERLGLKRAETALNYLVSNGVERDRLIALASMGELDPRIETPSRERLNRRVTTEVIGFVEQRDDQWPIASDSANAPRLDTSSPAVVANMNTASSSQVSEPQPNAQTSVSEQQSGDTASTQSEDAPTTDKSEPASSETGSDQDPDPTPSAADVRPNNGKGNGSEGDELDPGRSGKTKAAGND